MEPLTLLSSLLVVVADLLVHVWLLVPPLIADWVKHTPRVEIPDNLQRASGVERVLNEELKIYFVQFY